MNWFQTLNEFMDLRSFSNLWFWIALAVMWSGASHWVLGLPYDMVVRAAQNGGQAEQDLQDMVRININRMLYVSKVSGLWLIGFLCFLLSSLLLLGWVYGIEFAQACFLLGLPLSLVWGISLLTARRIRAQALAGADLRRQISRLRIYIQIIGMVSIFITSMWGIYSNFSAQLDQNHFRPFSQYEHRDNNHADSDYRRRT